MKYILLYLLLINLISFCLFYVDKRKAVKEKWRIKENTLHLVSCIGGVYASIIAMNLFHHKTRKLKFCFITFLALVLNILLIVVIIRYMYF